jgi:molybdopterin-guanine dinucleotide biosynthesis protein A
MKVIITMSGQSSRFVEKGYGEKSFIKLLGKTVIEHVVGMFPTAKSNIIFLVRDDDNQARERLPEMFPEALVVPIKPNRDGPVVSILSADLPIQEDEEVVISYCDLLVRWDFRDYIDYCRKNALDGCLASHVGWHPHRLYNDSFCFFRNDGNKILETREKQAFTDDPIQEHASNGTYYFKRFDVMRQHCRYALQGERVNGEYYVTMPYNSMIGHGLKVWLYEADHYICFGTPRDIELLMAWEVIIEQSGIDNDKDLIKAFRYWTQFLK